MRDESFRDELRTRIYEPHIRPITLLVDALRGTERGFIPHVSPRYGGVDAEVLCVFQDPGPKTKDTGGSGMLCADNDDPTAELFSKCLNDAGLEVARTITWNAYPWYINSSPTARQLEAGVAPLRLLLELLPAVSVVMLMGRRAEDGWKRLCQRYPEVNDHYSVIPSLHPSGRGITRGGQTSREDGIAQLTADLKSARAIVDRRPRHRRR